MTRGKPASQKLKELPVRVASQKVLGGIIAEVVKLEETRRAAKLYLWYGEPDLGDKLEALLAGDS